LPILNRPGMSHLRLRLAGGPVECPIRGRQCEPPGRATIGTSEGFSDNVSWRYLAVATEAVLRAGRIQRERYASGVAVEYKGEIDLVTEVDRDCELAILETIRGRYPEHDIVTEETDLAQSGSRFVWFIDPLDGTVNFAHSYPFFSA